MAPKIGKYTGPSVEPEEMVRVKRPAIVPGATDKKEGKPSVGNNSSASESTPQKSEPSERQNPPSPVQTTESLSNQTEQEISDANSTDGSTPETEKESNDGTSRALGARSASRRKAAPKVVKKDDFD